VATDREANIEREGRGVHNAVKNEPAVRLDLLIRRKTLRNNELRGKIKGK